MAASSAARQHDGRSEQRGEVTGSHQFNPDFKMEPEEIVEALKTREMRPERFTAKYIFNTEKKSLFRLVWAAGYKWSCMLDVQRGPPADAHGIAGTIYLDWKKPGDQWGKVLQFLRTHR